MPTLAGVWKIMETIGGHIVGSKIANDLFNQGTKILSQRIEALEKDNPRAEVLWILLALKQVNQNAYNTLLDLHHRQVLSGWGENEFVAALGHAIPRTKDGRIDWLRAQCIYTQISAMGPEEFYQFLELMTHDPVAQRLKGGWRWLNQQATELTQAIQQDTETRRQSWFTRLARLLSR